MKTIKIHPHTMKKAITVTLHAFPKKAFAEGLQANRKYIKDKPGDYDGIKLCAYKKDTKNAMWWIYYGDLKDNPYNYPAESRITGHFKTKKEAVGWFQHGGR